MTTDERQQTVDFLRQLAAWLEDGEELESRLPASEWTPMPHDVFYGWFVEWRNRVRAKPKPLEVWFVEMTYGGIYYESDDALVVSEREKDPEYVRTVHLREVP